MCGRIFFSSILSLSIFPCSFFSIFSLLFLCILWSLQEQRVCVTSFLFFSSFLSFFPPSLSFSSLFWCISYSLQDQRLYVTSLLSLCLPLSFSVSLSRVEPLVILVFISLSRSPSLSGCTNVFYLVYFIFSLTVNIRPLWLFVFLSYLSLSGFFLLALFLSRNFFLLRLSLSPLSDL